MSGLDERGSSPSSPRREQTLALLGAELREARAEHRRDVDALREELARVAQLVAGGVQDCGGDGGVDALREELARVDALVADGADLLSQALPRISQLDEGLAVVTGQVDELTQAVTATAAAAVDWPALNVDDARAEWEALADWIANVFGPVYEIERRQLPDCWPLHRPAVVELVWLRRTYVAAHRGDALPTASAEWHTRWRRDALANIAAVIDPKWCRPGEHYIDEYSRNQPQQPVAPRPPYEHVPGQRPGTGAAQYGPGREIIRPDLWWPHLQTAAAADLAWRQERAATAAGEQGE